MKKYWIVISLIIALGIVLVVTQTKKEQGEIKIGVILPLTGEIALHGEDAKKGIELAVSSRNISGGIIGRKIEIIFEDDGMTPVSGVAAFKKLVDLDKVKVVLGGMTSSVALAIAPIANEKRVILFSPTASHPKLTTENGYVFRNWPSDIYEASEISKFAFDVLKLKKYAVIFVNNDNGFALSEIFGKRIKELGGSVILSQSYESRASDFKTILSKAKNLNPDSIFLPGNYEDIAKILVQSKELGLNTQFIATSAIENPKLLEIARNAAEGLIYTKTYIDFQDPDYVIFVEEFKNKFGEEPGIAAAQCYDAINIIANAIEKAGYDREKIKNELYKIKEFPGVTGKTSFEKNGDVIKDIAIYTIRNGEFIKY